jgi:hypothetical protein
LAVAVAEHRALLAVGAVGLVAVTLVSAVTPPEARANSVLGVDVNPLNWPGEILGGIGGDIAKLAVGAFDAIIKALFAPTAKFVTTQRPPPPCRQISSSTPFAVEVDLEHVRHGGSPWSV